MATAPHGRSALKDVDEDGFRQAVEPLMDDLIKAARQDLRYYVRQGAIHANDFAPEEVAGEAVIYAWEQREAIPEQMSLRGWLLGTQYRVLYGMVEAQRQYRHDKAISLDAPVPPNPDAYDSQEWFWDWYQPEKVITWGDVTPSVEPIDYQIPLVDAAAVLDLEADERHALMMHDEFEMDMPEVAFVMGRSVNGVAELIARARASLRERMVMEDADGTAAEPPAPPTAAE